MSMIPEEAVQAAWHKARNAWMNASRHGTQEDADAAAVSALTAALPYLGWRVKELAWVYVERSVMTYVASDERGLMYYINQSFGSDSYYFATVRYSDGNILYDGDDLEAAKSAAQQDYAARIMSALEASPAQDIRAAALAILHCWKCGADESSTYLGAPGPGAVKCFAVGCDAEITGFSSDKEAIAEWNRRALAMDEAMTEAYRTDDKDELTECFQHHIRTSIGWQAFGARPGKEMQMYEEGFKAGYRRCKSDNEPELGEAEELSYRARKIVGRLREGIKAGSVNLSDVEDAIDLILDQDVRALSGSGDGSLPQDVINLVIAAREVFETDILTYEGADALDKALKPFSERVPYENEPSAPADGGENNG